MRWWFLQCCYSPPIKAGMYSPSRYVLRQEEFCALQDCHPFIMKHYREAAHRNTLPVVVPWSISTCVLAPKQLLIPELSVYQVSMLGSVILPGVQHCFIVGINTLHFLPPDIFLRVLTCFNAEGYFWKKSFICLTLYSSILPDSPICMQ